MSGELCVRCEHPHRFTDVCGFRAAVGPFCECRPRTLWEVVAAADGGPVPQGTFAEAAVVVRLALGSEWGRQIGVGYSEPDLDGLTNAVVAALML